MAGPFKFDLVSPERLLISEDVEQVLVPGSEGDFAMLQGHAPIIATLRPGLLEITFSGGREARYFVRGGFAEANPAGLTILAGTAVALDELNAEIWAETIRTAEVDLADAKDDQRRNKAQIQLDQLRQVQSALSL